MKETKYNKIVKYSAWYDLIVTAPFAFSLTAPITINTLNELHVALNFQGTYPTFEPTHFFFINLMGSIILVWSVLRIRHTRPLYGLYDAFARTAFSMWMIIYLTIYGISPTIFFFLVPEILWGIVQYWGYWKYKSSY